MAGAPSLRCLGTPFQTGSIPKAQIPKIETDADYKGLANIDFNGAITDVLGKSLAERMTHRFLMDTVREGVGGEVCGSAGVKRGSVASDGADEEYCTDTSRADTCPAGTSCADTSIGNTSAAVNITREFEGGGEKSFLRKPLLSRDLNAEKIAVKYR